METSQTKVAALLRSVLQLAYKNRWIADFLFNDLSVSPFHQTLPLHPHVFATSLPTDMLQHITLVLDQPPAFGRRAPGIPPRLLGPCERPRVDKSLLHTLYTPVASVGTTTVGYVIAAHEDPIACSCMRHNPLIPPYLARFAHDVETGVLIHVVRGGEPKNIGIRIVRECGGSCVREHFHFIIADAPYRWPHLPTSATWMLSHIEADTSVGLSQTYVQDPEDNGSGDGESIGAQCDDAAPWPVGEDGGLSDGRTPLFDAPANASIGASTLNDVETSASAFSASRRVAGTQALRAMLRGRFTSPCFKIDALDGMTGSFLTAVTGAVTMVHTPSQADWVAQLRQRFVNAYFSSALPVSSDGWLRPTSEAGPVSTERGAVSVGAVSVPSEDGEGSVETDGGLPDKVFRFWESLITIGREATASPAPPALNATKRDGSAMHGNTRDKDAECEAEVPIAPAGAVKAVKLPQRREDVLADRKRRNRLSAARSNEKKRIWIEKLETDVKEGRDRVAELTKRRDQISQENDALRRKLAI